MPRDGSQQYSVPPGTDGIPDFTIESTKYNTFIHDVEADLNAPRPIVAGGTGASSADGALDNLSAEKFKQVVTSWDTTVWRAGSFYAATTATGIAPVAGHAFAGIVYYANATDLVCEATDLTDPFNPTKYIRIMVAGVWGNWLLASGGSGTTGDYTFDNTTTFPPASGQIRFNNAIENSTTEIFLSHLNALGVDLTGTLSASLKSGYDIFVQDKDEPTKYKIFTATAAPVISGGDFRILVALKTAGADIVSGQRVVTSISTGSAVVYDVAQGLTINQQAQGRSNIGVTKKNYIINGAMMVSQENGATGGGINGLYPVDQWYGTFSLTTGAPYFGQNAQRSLAGSTNTVIVSCTTAQPTIGTSYVYLIQRIEGLRIADLMWGTPSAKTVTLQFGVQAQMAGTYQVVIQNFDNSSSTTFTYTIAAGEAGTPVIKSIVIPGVTTGTWKIDNTLGMQVVFIVAGAGQTGNIMASTPSYIQLFDVSLTEGNVAPPFMVPDYASELAACRRYFQLSPHVMGQFVQTTTFAAVIPFNPPMRAPPTLTTKVAASVNEFGVNAYSIGASGLVGGGGGTTSNWWSAPCAPAAVAGHIGNMSEGALTINARL